MNPLDIQIGGNHYKKFKIQPVELYNRFCLGFGEANVIKYAMRHQDKNGLQDLEKVNHYIDLMIQFNNPIGAFIPMDYIEYFANQNDLNGYAKDVIEEISLWLVNRSNIHLHNIKVLTVEEIHACYNPRK